MTETMELMYARDHALLVVKIPEGARYVGALYHQEIGWYKRYYEKDGTYYALNDNLAAYEERRKQLDEEMRDAAIRAREKKRKKRA